METAGPCFFLGTTQVPHSLKISLFIANRMVTGRFKIFDHCSAWYEELRQYHRKDGRIVTAHDDLLDATLYFSRFVGPRCTTIGPSTGKSGHLYLMRFNLCSTLAILIKQVEIWSLYSRTEIRHLNNGIR